MRAAFENTAGIGVVALVAQPAENLALHHLGEADNRVEWRAQFVTHRRQERRFGAVRGLRLLLGSFPFGDLAMVVERDEQTGAADQNENQSADDNAFNTQIAE